MEGKLVNMGSINWEGRQGEWWCGRHCCTVVCAAGGYPENPIKGVQVRGLDAASKVLNKSGKVYHAGTVGDENGVCLTNGGRVLAISSKGSTLQQAIDDAYQGVAQVSFDGMQYRTDIGQRGLHPPVRIGVLGSTRGTSLQPIIDAIERGQLNAQISLIASNKRDAGILERGRSHHISTLHIPCKKTQSREEYDRLTLQALRNANVELVLLIGYMRIVSSVLVQAFSMRCFNVHPSLLPLHKGGVDADVHAAVLCAKERQTGCTVHVVTEEVDAGPIVVQKQCDVFVDDTIETLKARVQQLEGVALIEAIERYQQGLFKPAGKITVTYKDAGVDIDAGEKLVRNISPLCKQTRRAGCDADLGGFGGMFDLAQAGYMADDTVLVSGTDGVGTKLKVVQDSGMGAEDIGVDLVAMCVNDVLTTGAEPLFFLDYFATGKLDVDQATQVISGIARGCQQAGCALIGGETAEMPGMYQGGDFDLAGFSVGAVRRADILPRGIVVGDICVSLPSSGVHSNGFSLVRKCVEKSGIRYSDSAPFSAAYTLAQALLVPTKIYVQELMPLIKRGLIKGMAHITGGGLLENLPRILPDNVAAHIDIEQAGWHLPPVFQWVQSIAQLPQHELLRTFNCGIGMVLVVSPEHADEIVQMLSHAMTLGRLIQKDEGGEAVVIQGELK
ncbi:phosphoribosylformylglycinamidine cyclo-ligase [archaeon]|nr:MAG: phosphoribosylformylglycinamidine cyclo-ligase [archaeon]